MNKRIPQIGDIWQDYHGHFLVLEEHSLTDFEKKHGYVCEINILELETGKIETFWAVSLRTLKELTFVA